MNKNQYRAVLNYSYVLDGITYYNSSSSNSTLLEYKDVTLDVKKIANKKHFKPGDEITYVIIIHNNSNYNLSNVVIRDNINLQTLNETSITVDAVNNVSYHLTDKKENLFEIVIEELPANLTAYISYTCIVNEELDSNTNLIGSAEVAVEEYIFYSNKLEIEQKYAQLLCQKEATKLVYPNKEYTYEIKVTNVGSADATNVDLYDQLPNNFVLKSVTLNNNNVLSSVENNLLKIFISTLCTNETLNFEVTGMITK